MAAEWYFRNEGEKVYGPFSAAQLKQIAREGRIAPETIVRKGEAGRWVKASEVRGLFDNEQQSAKQPSVAAPNGT